VGEVKLFRLVFRLRRKKLGQIFFFFFFIIYEPFIFVNNRFSKILSMNYDRDLGMALLYVVILGKNVKNYSSLFETK
jgi:hypothetical protein